MKILLNEEQIQTRVKQLAAEIQNDFKGDINAIVVLNGSIIFFSDLVRHIENNITFFPIKVESYEGTESTGDVRILLDADIKGDILIVEDIVDTGNTIAKLKKHFEEKGNKSKVVTLLDKPDRRMVEVKIDYVGFSIPNKFVVGYGLDYNQKYRNLPYVGSLDEDQQ